MKKRPTIRQVAIWLRKEFPVKKEIGHVRCFKFSNKNKLIYAFTTIAGNIQLNNLYHDYLLREALLHEWAHIRTDWLKKQPHHQEFWKELGRITNAYDNKFTDD